MASFANPFAGNVPRKMTREELIQAIRLNIAGELEAIYVYDAHVQATDDPVAKKVIADIRDEEKAHVGELMTLLRHLDPEEAEHFAEGEEEVREMLQELNFIGNSTEKNSESKPESTIGSLIGK
ncbi:MAG TPA: ubiquinone biosynthesis protein COQ7 [Clostridiaceae bacterium]|nr:ubiquinone biosynthesis protein COQ7 [Clostridiaceae bacterium]